MALTVLSPSERSQSGGVASARITLGVFWYGTGALWPCWAGACSACQALTKAQAVAPSPSVSLKFWGGHRFLLPPLPLVHLFYPFTTLSPKQHHLFPITTHHHRQSLSPINPIRSDPYSFHCSQDCIQLRQPDHTSISTCHSSRSSDQSRCTISVAARPFTPSRLHATLRYQQVVT